MQQEPEFRVNPTNILDDRAVGGLRQKRTNELTAGTKTLDFDLPLVELSGTMKSLIQY